MKAERRHELQTNSLALWLQIRLPEYWQKYGNHILLGLIIIVGGFWFVRWRVEAPKIAAANAGQKLSDVARSIQEMRPDQPNGFFRHIQRTQDEGSDIPQRIAEALNTSDNKDIQAMGFALLGDYHWSLASLPQGFTSMPAKSSPDELFRKADEAYRKSLEAGSRQMDLLARAHFGRAIIAEQQAWDLARKEDSKSDPAKNPFWQTAKAEYEAVANEPEMMPAFASEAKAKLQILEKMQKPVWIALPAPTSLPASMLGPLGPELPPALIPSVPATPTTPTTRPTTKP